MSTLNHNKHLTLNERIIIETGINNGSTKASIANTIGKDPSTVGKEIKEHREIRVLNPHTIDCKFFPKCKLNRSCSSSCDNYVEFTCSRRDRSPGACNGCETTKNCRHNKYLYNAQHADEEYRETLVDSRRGVDLTTEDAKRIADVVGPLLRKGQSPYHIITNHPELGICEKTLYNYIEGGVFGTEYMGSIGPLDLRRQVGRKLPKKQAAEYKKRQDRKYLSGRLYTDFKQWHKENPYANYAEMDTVYNDIETGPFMQTFTMKTTGFILAVYHETKTAEDMIQGVNELDALLGLEIFEKYFGVILTDRGTEFSTPDRMETREDGTLRTRIFYCDPMQSGQKGSLEEKHVSLRYIFPKKTDLRKNGLIGQEPLNKALSHINSAPLEMLNGKTPFEYIHFMYPDLYAKVLSLGIKEVDKDQVILKPYLLK